MDCYISLSGYLYIQGILYILWEYYTFLAVQTNVISLINDNLFKQMPSDTYVVG